MAARYMAVPVRKTNEFRLHVDYLRDFPDEELRRRFRFGRTSIEFITDLIKDEIQRDTKRNHALSPTLQVLVALRFFATGAFLQVIGDSFGLDKSTVSRIVTRVSQALTDKQARFIQWPCTQDDKRRVFGDFYKIDGFPRTLGCIDGTHIRIQAPRDNEPAFVNRKQFHSINVQAVCDGRSKFTNIVAKWPGSTHDSHIFRTSQLCQYLEQHHAGLEDGVLLGDSGYALRPFLLTPYLRPTNNHQTGYNAAHKRTRCLIERVFGQWKRRFHVLHTEIRMNPSKACLIIGACAVLHNIAKELGEPESDGDDAANDQPPAALYNGDLDDGKRFRDHIAATYF